ncbi:allophanate hydrolase subunit 1 [Pigmentiphaga aceris]|uniref:Allophanate hydrolase subunit 1 n=1 Tax=Pigmentiphaga aceris TaxID=1940612 RepID=A0A5C0B2R1_9BURK|nr:allophanate hydrolase subunit 1 [Pigmentiphaga aceris]QEI08156.1 allophanate hydrolase subunit 1 [Pigmentiphaga aceris]
MATATLVPHLTWRIEPVGDRCLIIRLGDRVDIDVSQTVHAVAAQLMHKALPGVIDVVPAFTTVAVHYRAAARPVTSGSGHVSGHVSGHISGHASGHASAYISPYKQLKRDIDALLSAGVPALPPSTRVVDIPACYGGEFGPDLEDVATQCGLSADEVIRRHSQSPLILYTFFFAPGNPFAGPVDPSLQVPRRRTPRTRVPAGSVAIANGISSIYQNDSPGGWNIIARTPWNLFDARQNPPTRLQLGDQLRFVPISRERFAELLEARS